jgi:hypothetical protein
MLLPVLTMTPTTLEQKKREILESLDRLSITERRYANSDPIIHSEHLRATTSFGDADNLETAFLAVLDMLENDKMIILTRSLDSKGVRLATLGKQRLLTSEEEYHRKSGNVSGGIYNTFHGPVQQFAVTTGPNSPVDPSEHSADQRTSRIVE